MSSLSHPVPNKYLNRSLWFAQFFVAFVFLASGLSKLFLPIPELAAMMTWPGQYPVAFVRSIGLVDMAGGIGIVLPSLTRIRPWLTVLAALCCVVLQMLAIAFHASRGEFSVLPLNFLLLPLCAFVLWGRGKRMPIASRGATAAHPR
ncbi:DoxX-like protein [Pseudoduganella flava]|nr:DoxX family protein [Pseudoduganella flava]TWI44391.1 DoxX-like protein [Pseudoduganella flava]